MRVIVQKAFGRHSVGAIIPEMPAGQARTLIARGLVREQVVEPSPGEYLDRQMRPAKASRGKAAAA